jgi:hypothetical protein
MSKLIFRIAIVFVFLSQSAKLHAADSVYVFEEAHIQLTLDSHWHLQPKQDKNGFIIYVFKRDPIIDSSLQNIIPNAAVVIEKIDPKMDVVTYSVNKRGNASFDVTKMFIHGEGIINYVNAVGYKGTYKDQMDHTVYVVHAINKDKGIQIILDTTTETLPAIEAEFLQILKSIKS